MTSEKMSNLMLKLTPHQKMLLEHFGKEWIRDPQAPTIGGAICDPKGIIIKDINRVDEKKYVDELHKNGLLEFNYSVYESSYRSDIVYCKRVYPKNTTDIGDKLLTLISNKNHYAVFMKCDDFKPLISKWSKQDDFSWGVQYYLEDFLEQKGVNKTEEEIVIKIVSSNIGTEDGIRARVSTDGYDCRAFEYNSDEFSEYLEKKCAGKQLLLEEVIYSFNDLVPMIEKIACPNNRFIIHEPYFLDSYHCLKQQLNAVLNNDSIKEIVVIVKKMNNTVSSILTKNVLSMGKTIKILVNPNIHGRYFLCGNKGFTVDNSLNGLSNDRISIYKVLTKNEVHIIKRHVLVDLTDLSGNPVSKL